MVTSGPVLDAQPTVVVDAQLDAGEQVGALVAPRRRRRAARRGGGPRGRSRPDPLGETWPPSAASPRWRCVFTELREMPSVVGDVVDPELVVVAQHEARALAGGSSRSASSTSRWSSRRSISSSTPGLIVVERQVVAQRHEPPPVVVAGEVEHDRAQVGRRLGRVLDPVDVAGQADERLLHEVLGGVAVVDEQAGEAHERRALGSRTARPRGGRRARSVAVTVGPASDRHVGGQPRRRPAPRRRALRRGGHPSSPRTIVTAGVTAVESPFPCLDRRTTAARG